jgi:iron complex outermembrane receptor protein
LILVIFVVLGNLNTQTLHAQDQPVHQFDIPAQMASRALNLFARQAEQQVLFRYDRLEGITTNAVKGQFTASEALVILLQNTGLEPVFSENGVLSIKLNEHNREMNKKRGLLTGLSALLATAGSSQLVTAQETTSLLEEVVVTAQKRSESVQDVPIAINALTGDSLDEMGVTDVNDITGLYPNLSVTENSQVVAQYRVRGVGTESFHSNAVSAVGLYYDEVSLNTPFSGALGVYDLERVEVLRGPQNTLFGRNTTGGAVNFISRKPEIGEELNGYIRGIYGSFDKQDVELAIGFPMGATMAGRFSLQSNNRGDVFNNLVPGEDDVGKIERHSGRFQVTWEPTESTNLLFNYHFGYNRGDAGYGKANGLVDPNGGNCINNGVATLSDVTDFNSRNGCVTQIRTGTQANTSTDDWEDLYSVSSNTGDIDIDGAFVKLIHDFENLTLTSITSYDETKVMFREDEGAAPFGTFSPQQNAEYESFSQELRLTSNGDGDLRWMGGIYYFNDRSTQGTNVHIFTNSGSSNPATGLVNSVILKQDNEVYSAYGQIIYELSEQWSLNVGIRWTEETKAGDRAGYRVTGVGGSSYWDEDWTVSEILAQGVQFASASGELVNEEVGYNAILSYHLNEDVMFYGSISNGFKAGSFDIRALAIRTWGTPDEQEVDPETLNAFELGMKSTLLDGAMQLNASIFYYDFQDLQFFTVVDGIPGLFNVPTTEISGLDLDMIWVPAENWYMSIGLGYLNSEVTNAADIPIPEGEPLAQSPEWSFNGLVQKDFPLAFGNLQVQTSFRYVDERISTTPDLGVSKLDSEFWLNARSTLTFGADEEYELAVFVDNITEVESCGEMSSLANPLTAAGAPGPTSVVKCMPNEGVRLWGISGTVNF